jgi:hypothetical protein
LSSALAPVLTPISTASDNAAGHLVVFHIKTVVILGDEL